MARALELAERGRRTTRPNPMVGCVIVSPSPGADTVLGQGVHLRAGEPHAEIHALRDAGEAARGAELFVTLEPCNHTGRTGPCTEAIIAAGVRRVVIGAGDPNPLVSGAGVTRLREAGVAVELGVLEDACLAQNTVFAHWITTGRPWVVLKLAQSLDGRIAVAGGISRWITGTAAREAVHGLRAAADAVMVGGRTALIDDPRLTVRGAQSPDSQPARVVVDTNLDVPARHRIFSGAGDPPVIVATARPEDDPAAERLRGAGAQVWSLPNGHGRVDLVALVMRLGCREPTPICSLLVEGGGQLAAGLWRAGLIDQLHLFVAPIWIGAEGVPAMGPLGINEPGDAPRLVVTSVRQLGDDVEIVAHPSTRAASHPTTVNPTGTPPSASHPTASHASASHPTAPHPTGRS